HELFEFWFFHGGYLFFIVKNIKNITFSAFGEIKQKVADHFKETVYKINRVIVSSIVILIGIIFLMLGLAIFINELVGATKSLGYLAVGLTVVIIGIVVHEHPVCSSRKPKKNK
ncbi:hypothetical protein KJ912_01880, partial [Patescibacteria group bacterium]|nr:hypothetical protein [Patescibacteria group bacterium]